MPAKSRQREWLSTLSQGSKADSPQRRLARLLLLQMPRLDQATFTRRMEAIRRSDPVAGNLALHWLLSTLARQSHGIMRVILLKQAETCMKEAVVMRELRKGWSQFGVSDPWFVVHPPAEPWLPRYNSEPILQTCK